MSEQITIQSANVTETPKLSKLSILRKLLGERRGYTKAELAELTGLNPNTVNCQMYYHLPSKGFKVEKLADKKYRFITE
jgi:hypothetical protein